MKESYSLSTSCENAAVRIHRWLGRDKEILLNHWNAFVKEGNFSKVYKCDCVKPPKIPPQLKVLPLGKESILKKRRSSSQRVVTKENLVSSVNYSLNQKYPYHHSSKSSLTSERVAPWPFKEHFFVCKQMKQLSKQVHAGPRWRNITSIKSSEEANDREPNPYLAEWGNRKEERQFQITRITKYLLD